MASWISLRASMRVTASSAIGEIGAGFFLRLALVVMSVSTKNWRRAWDQHNAWVED